MALQNGVLVHGMTSWACAVRDADGELHVASGRKPHLAPAARVRMPILRGPIALAEAFALLPMIRRALPQARFPFEQPAVLGSIAATAVAARALRRSGLPAGAREVVAGGVAFLPALLALRGPGLAAYHGAEHVSIGTYENGGTPAPKEHPRCGSQLIAPMVVSTLAANIVASKAPAGTRRLARLVGMVAAVGGSVELFSWVARNPENRIANALARPGFELQRRFSTAEPSDAQLEVANVARDACLALER
ncbi:MAG: DUF1385 domain-containing protein [Thermoleophilia bacterium]|nr:DUF1385 domain-containing protein [Thermoleophilia bacterium]MDH4339170.1 DUF1385 domain-containing protein [Thermoleophilia bacterium]MDH5280749.1 DUF1385 domain-containing protein [Thermoleophilia bacterium]